MGAPVRLVFLGSDAIALPLLNWLVEGSGASLARLVGVVTGPDRPAGRGQQTQPNPVGAWAAGRAFPILKPERLDGGALEAFRALAPDLALVVAYGQILREDFIGVPRLGTLNLHASRLPAYRGASPFQTAVACGETSTAMTLMRIVRRLDAGPVAAAEIVAIGPRDTALDVEGRLAAAAPVLLARTLPGLIRGDLPFLPQDEARATYCRKLSREDAVLDFSAGARILAARVNGLNPWPSVSICVGDQAVRVGLAEAVAQDGAPAGIAADPGFPGDPGMGTAGSACAPGTVLGRDREGLLVATGGGLLRLLRLQRPGGKMLPAGEFLRGFPIAAGTVLASAPMPPLVGPVPFRGAPARPAS